MQKIKTDDKKPNILIMDISVPDIFVDAYHDRAVFVSTRNIIVENSWNINKGRDIQNPFERYTYVIKKLNFI